MIALLLALAQAEPADDALERGRYATTEKRWVDARDLAMKALELRADDFEAHELYQRSMRELGLSGAVVADGQVAEAVHLWDRVRRGADGRRLEDLDVEGPVDEVARAWLALRRGQPQQAIDRSRKIAHPRATEIELQALTFLGREGDAKKRVLRALSDDPTHPEVARVLWPEGHPRTHKAVLKKTEQLAGETGDIATLYRLWAVFEAARDYDAVRDVASRLKKIGEPVHGRAVWNRPTRGGIAQVQVVINHHTTVPLGGEHEMRLVGARMARLWNNIGQPDKALETLADVRKKVSVAPRVARQQAAMLRELERPAEAVAMLAEARDMLATPAAHTARFRPASLSHRMAQLWGDQAEMLLEQGHKTEALEAAEIALTLAPQERYATLYAKAGAPAELPADGSAPVLPPRRGAEALAAARGESLGEVTTAFLLQPTAERAAARAGFYKEHPDAWFGQLAVVHALGGFVSPDDLAAAWKGLGSDQDALEALAERWKRLWDGRSERIKALSVQKQADHPKRRPRVGKTMPAWSVQGADGVEISSATTAGEVVLLTLWATWCEPCMKELPALDAVATRLREDKVPARIVAVNIENQAAWKRVRADRYPNLDVAWSASLDKTWSATSLPVSWLVDRDGKVHSRHAGFAPGDELQREDEIRSLSGM